MHLELVEGWAASRSLRTEWSLEYTRSRVIYIPAYAKLNLALSIIGRRPDGRHDLHSVVVHVDWHDLVGVERTPPGSPPSLVLTGEWGADTPPDGSNLVLRAAMAMTAGPDQPGVRVALEKRIPVAAGLGGGSADAAAAIRLLAPPGPRGEGPHPDALLAVADSLGSDVPACLVGGTLLVGGAGERLDRLEHHEVHLAVAVAGRSSTAATFAALDPSEWRGPGRPAELARRLRAGEPPDPALCGSDLEAAACRANPRLAAGLARLRAAAPAAAWHLTGSGGACFALARGPGEARRLAAAAVAAGLPARACRTVPAPAGWGVP